MCHVGGAVERIAGGEIDPSFLLTHFMALEDAPQAYQIFHPDKEGCSRVVMRP